MLRVARLISSTKPETAAPYASAPSAMQLLLLQIGDAQNQQIDQP